MNGSRILVIYGTSFGQTAKIAERIRYTLTSSGHDVVLVDVKEVPADLSLAEFDGTIVGSSIIAGGHQRSVVNFVRSHLDLLNRFPSAFYSVSASAGSIYPAERAAAQRLLDDFLAKMGWRPRLRASIAGAVNYPRYGFFLRWYMKRASKKNGGAIDTSREHEYTDWAQVEHFAQDFAAQLQLNEAVAVPG